MCCMSKCRAIAFLSIACKRHDTLLPWLYLRCNVYMTVGLTILYYLNHCIYAVLQLRPALVNSRSWGRNPIDRLTLAKQKGERVRYVIDRMTMSDVPRVIEIER